MHLRVDNFEDLSRFVINFDPDYIIIEGYNGVGKSVVIENLANIFNFVVYRPDYLGWANLVDRSDRWAINASFLDIMSRTYNRPRVPIIFDRGIITGCVYNDDLTIARECASLLKSNKVLHILVTCTEEDYSKYLQIRNSQKELTYADCELYTYRYLEALRSSGANFVEYLNKFNEENSHADTCAGCSHYTQYNNKCNNPVAINNGIVDVSPDRERCQYSMLSEVQDSGKLQLV